MRYIFSRIHILKLTKNFFFFQVIHCTGRLIAHSENVNTQSNGSGSENQEEIIEKEPGISLVVVASPVPHPSNIETPLGKYTFLSKHNLNMKFTYADDKLVELIHSFITVFNTYCLLSKYYL